MLLLIQFTDLLKKQMVDFEEYTKIKQKTGWILIALMSVSLIGWAMISMIIIKNKERVWKYAILDDTPAASVYSTYWYNKTPVVPLQVDTLPGVKNKEKIILPENYK